MDPTDEGRVCVKLCAGFDVMTLGLPRGHSRLTDTENGEAGKTKGHSGEECQFLGRDCNCVPLEI
jgi:hypothetical protein